MSPKKLQLSYCALSCLLAFSAHANASQAAAPTAASTTARLPFASQPARDIILEQRGEPQELKRVHRRAMATTPIQSTGFWLAKGEKLTVEYGYDGEEPSTPPEVWIVPIANAADQDLSHSSRHIVKLKPGGNTIVSPNFPGVIYIAPRNQPNPGKIKVRLAAGGQAIPRFILGHHQNADWPSMLHTHAAAPYAELVGKRMILTMPHAIIKRHVDDPSAVLALWDRIVTLTEEQHGLTPGYPVPHQATPFQHQFVTKADSSSGYMSASDFWLGTNVAGAGSVLNTKNLQQDGWGPWHEIGHHYQLSALKWDGQGEVTVNLTSLYVQRALNQPSRLETSGVWKNVQRHLAQATPNYQNQKDLFVRVAMLWQLDLAFGKDFYARLGQRYRSMPIAEHPNTNTEKQQSFILEASRIAGHDLTPFFDKWGLSASPQTRQQLAALQLRALKQAIWENTDNKVQYRYSPAQQNIAGQVQLPDVAQAGQPFNVNVAISNRDAGQLSYQWELPEGFRLDSPGNQAAVKVIAPPNVLQNSHAPIRVTVSGGQDSITFGSHIRLNRPGPQISPVQAFDAMMAAENNTSQIHTWSGSSLAGTLGDIYAYDNGYRPTRDYFRLKKSPYWYFPTDGDSNQYWQFLTSYDGAQYLDSQWKPETSPPPAARITGPANAQPGAAVTLSGASSSGEKLKHQWNSLSGVAIKPNGASMTFTAPHAEQDRQYDFKLTVTDEQKRVAEATHAVKVPAKEIVPPPQAKISGPQEAKAGQLTTLSGASSSGKDLKYLWSSLSGVAIKQNGPSMTFTPPSATENRQYSFQLVVTDGLNRKAEAHHQVSVKAESGGGETIPAWDRKKVYASPCAKVSHAGKIWMNGWWIQGSEPGSGGVWDAWRAVGAPEMHAACKGK